MNLRQILSSFRRQPILVADWLPPKVRQDERRGRLVDIILHSDSDFEIKFGALFIIYLTGPAGPTNAFVSVIFVDTVGAIFALVGLALVDVFGAESPLESLVALAHRQFC